MRLEILSVVIATIGVYAPQAAFIQGMPTIGTAPPRVAYKAPPKSKERPIQDCSPEVLSQQEPNVIYKMGAGVIAPRITQDVAVEMTKLGREAYRQNLFKDPNDVVSRISTLVDSRGKPQGLCLAGEAGFDLDQQAANAVLQYRFKAAQKDEKPVAMRITIEIVYQTH